MLEECKESVRNQTVPVQHLVGNGDGRPEADVVNELIARADCDAYIILNDDDLLLPECVEKCAARIRNHDAVYPWCRVEGRDYAFDVDFTCRTDIPITALIRKSLWERLGGYRPYGQYFGGEGTDGDFWDRAQAAGARLTHIPEHLWVYRFHGDNMSMRVKF